MSETGLITEDFETRLTRGTVLKAGVGLVLAGTLGRSATALGALAAGPGDGKTIGLTVIGINQYVQCMITGVLKELQGTGYAFAGLNSNFDPASEISNFETLISKKVDGILVLPVTPQSAARGALAASKAGIPVVNLAWALPTQADKSYVARIRIDNKKGANLVVDWLSKNAKPGEVVFVEGLPGNEFNDQFKAGLKAGFARLGGGWKLVGTQPGLYVRDKAITAAEDLMTAHPKATVIVDIAAEMGAGIASWLERERRKDIVHITSDGNPEMASWMKKGYITAVRYYSSAEEGRLGVKLMRKYLEQNQRSGVVDLGMSMATAKNIAATQKATPLCYDAYMGQARKVS